MQLTGAAGAFLLLALAGILISIWRQQQRARLLRAQMEQERAISNLRGYAEKIVASVPSGLLLLSADLVVLSVNPSFLESFRLRKDEVVGHPLARHRPRGAPAAPGPRGPAKRRRPA